MPVFCACRLLFGAKLLRAVRRGLDADTFRPDFMAFNHRGQMMPLDVPPLPKQ